VTIQVSVKHKRLKRAEIRRQMPDGTESVERMALIAEEPDGTKRFSLTFPAVEEGFDYRVRAGAALSRYFDVTAVEPPTVTKLEVKYDYPEYTALPDAGGETETGEIRAVAHTRGSVTATLNKPAWSAKLVVNETPSAAEPIIAENQATWEFELKNGMRGSWHLDFADEEGFKNQPSSYPIEVLPDKAPTVQIVSPTQRDISLKPTERLPINLSVVEDFGFGDVVLMATPDGAVEPTQLVQPSPATTNRPGTYAAQAVLDLPALKLTPDQRRLAVQIRVRDNRPEDFDGPGVGLSEVIFVTIDQNAKSLADQAIEAQKKEVDETIREARQELEKARDDLRRAEQELIRDKEVNSQAKEKLDEFTEHNEAAREKLEQVAATLDTPLFQEQF
jgi:vacuolar-type H+-ATPase subunit H